MQSCKSVTNHHLLNSFLQALEREAHQNFVVKLDEKLCVTLRMRKWKANQLSATAVNFMEAEAVS